MSVRQLSHLMYVFRRWWWRWWWWCSACWWCWCQCVYTQQPVNQLKDKVVYLLSVKLNDVSIKNWPLLFSTILCFKNFLFSKFLHCWKDYKICFETHTYNSHFTVGMLLHYLGKLKMQIFADIQQMGRNVNKVTDNLKVGTFFRHGVYVSCFLVDF